MDKIEYAKLLLSAENYWIPPNCNHIKIVYYILEDCFPELSRQELNLKYHYFDGLMNWKFLSKISLDQLFKLGFHYEEAQKLVPYFQAVDIYLNYLKKSADELKNIYMKKIQIRMQNIADDNIDVKRKK